MMMSLQMKNCRGTLTHTMIATRMKTVIEAQLSSSCDVVAVVSEFYAGILC